MKRKPKQKYDNWAEQAKQTKKNKTNKRAKHKPGMPETLHVLLWSLLEISRGLPVAHVMPICGKVRVALSESERDRNWEWGAAVPASSLRYYLPAARQPSTGLWIVCAGWSSSHQGSPPVLQTKKKKKTVSWKKNSSVSLSRGTGQRVKQTSQRKNVPSKKTPKRAQQYTQLNWSKAKNKAYRSEIKVCLLQRSCVTSHVH